jgi:hypothetical protein
MTSGLTYPYTKYDRLLGTGIDHDLELSPGTVPPSGTAGGAGQFKYWVDTTNPALPVLRQCIATPRATAGVYVPAEWISLGIVDIAAGKFHFNNDDVDFVGGGGGTTTIVENLTVTNDLTVTDSLTVTGLTTLDDTNVNGTFITNGLIETQGPVGGFVFFDRTLTTHWWTWLADNDIAFLTSATPGGATQLSINAASGLLSVTGPVTAPSYQLSTVAFANRGANAHTIYDYDGAAAITLYGATGLQRSYYTNDTHTFQNNAGTTTLDISSAGDLTVPGRIDVAGLVAVTGILTAASVSAVTTVFAGTSMNTVEYQLRGIPFALTDLGSNYVKIYDPSQVNNMTLYATGENYHDATDHYFRNNFGMSTYAVFNATGTANATGSWLVISDDLVKENVTPYNAGLAAIRQLNPVSFNYIIAGPDGPAGMAIPNPFADVRTDDSIHGTIRYGLMASNVKPVLPEMVFANTFTGADFPATALDTILPTHLTYVLINAVKELDQEIIDLEASNEVFAPLLSPVFTGTPTAPTASRNLATTQLATLAFVRVGTDTNDSAPTGHVGEYLTNQTLSTAAIPLTTNVDTGVTTLLLTPGDWEVHASVGFNMSNPNNVTLKAWINPTGAATAPSIDQTGGHVIVSPPNNTPLAILPVTAMRVSLASAITIRLGTTATIGGGTVAAWGKIMARRVR